MTQLSLGKIILHTYSSHLIDKSLYFCQVLGFFLVGGGDWGGFLFAQALCIITKLVLLTSKHFYIL